MSALGFEEYVEPLKMYLHKYREVGNPLKLRSPCQSPWHSVNMAVAG